MSLFAFQGRGTPVRQSRTGRALRVGALLVLAAAVLPGCAGLRPAVPSVESSAREVLLTVGQRGTAAIGLTGAPETRYLRRRGYESAPPEIDRLLSQLAAEHGLERKEGWPIRSLDVYCEVLIVPDGSDVDVIIERLRADPRVDLAQRMNVFETLASGYDDPFADLLPAALELGVEQAHRIATGKGVRVAVVDSAVDTEHPELAGRVSVARDFVEPGGKWKPEVHGTAVAGVIAAAANNREGIFGIAPDAEIAALRACWSQPTDPSRARCTSFTLARAVEAAIVLQAEILNLSLSGPPDPLLERLIDEAVSSGIIVVTAEPPLSSVTAPLSSVTAPLSPVTAPLSSATEPLSPVTVPSSSFAGPFPSAHPEVIVARAAAGAASAPRSPLAAYELPAPADEILTTTPGAGYAFFSGTSLAAAHLSGVIALLLERAPTIGSHGVMDVLQHTLVRDAGRVSVNACYALEVIADVRACGPGIETASAEIALD